MARRLLYLLLLLGTLPLFVGPLPSPRVPPASVLGADRPMEDGAATLVEDATQSTASQTDRRAAVIAVREEPVQPESAPEGAAPANPSLLSAPRRSWLSVPAVGLEVPVRCCYRDMTGQAIPAHGVATIDARAGANNLYLLGHNPGIFGPLLGLAPGALVRYWDGEGTPRDFVVQTRYSTARTDVSPLVASYGTLTLTLQTCLTGTASTVWVWRAAGR